ncbi:MAG: CvpA family protein [Rhodospirillales bacterium]|nr:CvpA family protein [Rhodospirillales bacterium]
MDKVNELPINVFDAGVILVLLISAFLAYARGFVHEVLSIGGWIGAIFATFYGFPYLKPYAHELIAIGLAADLAAGLLIFIVSLVFLSYLSRAISKKVQSSALNALDRALGFLFGLVRGAIVVCIAYIGLGLVLPEEEQPPFITEAKSMELIKPGALLLSELLPANASSEAISEAASKAGKKTKELFGAKDVVDDLISPRPKSQSVPETGAYGRKERQDMERLIDSNRTNN